MPDPFVSLAFALESAAPPSDEILPFVLPSGAACPATGAPDGGEAASDETEHSTGLPSVAGVVRELTLLRLAALEAYARAKDGLLEALARDVLARELELSPVDLERLVRAGLARFSGHEPLALRVSASDAASLSVDIPVTIDPALGAGDLVIELRDGVADARFAVRLAGVVRGGT